MHSQLIISPTLPLSIHVVYSHRFMQWKMKGKMILFKDNSKQGSGDNTSATLETKGNRGTRWVLSQFAAECPPSSSSACTSMLPATPLGNNVKPPPTAVHSQPMKGLL